MESDNNTGVLEASLLIVPYWRMNYISGSQTLYTSDQLQRYLALQLAALRPTLNYSGAATTLKRELVSKTIIGPLINRTQAVLEQGHDWHQV